MQAVLFDLFGTIVQPYRRRDHHAALRAIARALGTTFEALLAGWDETWDARATGRYASITDNLRTIVPDAAEDRLAEANQIYEGFTIRSLVPKPGALDVLDRLRDDDLATALVTNCAPDVPELWAGTSWAPRFDAAVFSCSLGVKKPDPTIYREALDRLGVAAEDAAFVGDGSDRELQGAAAVGLRPVLVRNDQPASDGPAAAVTDEGWPIVDHLDQLPGVLERL